MLKVRLFGELGLDCDGAYVAPPTSLRARALLAWLALHPGSHPRAAVAARFWPDVLDSNARASLREALATLRRELAPAAGAHIVASAERLGLAADSVQTDVHAFRQRLRLGELEAAVEAAGAGELLADFNDEWVHQEREALRDQLAGALAALARRAEEASDAAAALQWTRRLVALDPLAEQPTRSLMRRLALGGDRAAALAAYGRLRDQLAADLQIAPSAVTRQLADRIRSGGDRVGLPAAGPAVRLDRATTTTESPPVRYASNGPVSIAFQVVGDGQIDLVYVPGFVSHLDAVWEHPAAASFLLALAGFSRLILFDKRGMGLSDRPPGPPTLEQSADDLAAVLDAVGSKRAVLFGTSEGGPMSMLFAASRTHRVAGLALYGTFASLITRPGYPGGIDPAARDLFLAGMRRGWGGPVHLPLFGPSAADDESVRRWWARLLRLGTSPGAAEELIRFYDTIDVRKILGAIRVPALVLHRAGDKIAPAAGACWLAGQIPGARFVQLPGEDHIPALGNTEPLLTALREFTRAVARTGRALQAARQWQRR